MKHGTKIKRCSIEGCTWGMGQWPNYAAHATDVPIKWSITIEEFVDRRHKAKQRWSFATMKDAQTKSSQEECVLTGTNHRKADLKSLQERRDIQSLERRDRCLHFFIGDNLSLLSDRIRGSYYLLTVSQYSETLKREEIDVYNFLLETICFFSLIESEAYPLHFAYHSQ